MALLSIWGCREADNSRKRERQTDRPTVAFFPDSVWESDCVKGWRRCLHPCVCASCVSFFPNKVRVFLVSNSLTGQEAFLTSEQPFEFPGPVPMTGEPCPGRGSPCLSPFFLFWPLPPHCCPHHPSWAAFSSPRNQGVGVGGPLQSPFAICRASLCKS